MQAHDTCSYNLDVAGIVIRYRAFQDTTGNDVSSVISIDRYEDIKSITLHFLTAYGAFVHYPALLDDACGFTLNPVPKENNIILDPKIWT